MTLMVRAGFVAIVGFIVACAIAVARQPAPAAAPAHPDVLISRQLAEAFGIAPGTLVRVSPDSLGGHAREFRVAGVYEPAPDPMKLNAAKHEVRLHLPDLLAMTADPADPLAAGTVDAINVALANPDDARAFARDAGVARSGHPRQVGGGRRARSRTFVVLERFHLAIAIVTIVASTMFLLALSVMLVDERRETVGILRLIGLTTRRILRAGAGRGPVHRRGWRAVRPRARARVGRADQPLFPVAVRHGARLRPDHAVRGAAIDR